MTSASPSAAFGVYVHWPFCLSKCPYCDFNSHVRHAPIDEDRFARAFAREIETTAARTPGREVSSIFLGGGTPSLMRPQTVGAILDAIGKHWRVARDAEVTLEANPTSVEATRFTGYRTAGVNRVSLGVQALDDASLRALGRLHTAQEALDAVDALLVPEPCDGLGHDSPGDLRLAKPNLIGNEEALLRSTAVEHRSDDNIGGRALEVHEFIAYVREIRTRNCTLWPRSPGSRGGPWGRCASGFRPTCSIGSG